MPLSNKARIWLRNLASARSSSFRASTAGGRCGITGNHGGSSTFRWEGHNINIVASCRPSFFSSHAEHLIEHEYDCLSEENEKSNSANANVNVKVADNGGHITIQFPSNHEDSDNGEESNNNNSKSTYHASWLWSNDPQRVVLPSGQRASTPGQYCSGSDSSRPRIKDATIIHCNIEQEKNIEPNGNFKPMHVSENLDGKERFNVPGPTFGDCCHPLAIYGSHPAWISATASTADDIIVSQANDNARCRPYLQILWSTPSTTTTSSCLETETKSIYDLEWLQRLQYDDASRLEHRRRTEIQPINAVRKDGAPLWYSTSDSRADLSALYQGDATIIPKHNDKDGLMHVNYQSIIGGDGQILQRGMFQLLHSVFKDGAAVVSNTPHSATTNNNVSELCHAVETMSEEELPVGNIARAMSGGSLSHGSLYGNIFHVRVGERNANNVAYTSNELPPHQDLAYYESPPGMQLLHCVAMGKGVVGGESTLIDAMAAAYRLRELRPESFECLVQCPATFVKQRDGACMTYRKPHIVLAEDGGGMGTRGIDREILAVFWSPPFEGPVCLPPEQVDRYYEAYADFERLLNGSDSSDDDDELSRYANEFTWEHKLNPGDMLVFNNRRMLHGRRGFSSAEGVSFEDGQRHLVGCYTNIDDTLNSYRVLLRDRGSFTSILNVGNGTNIIP